MTYRKWICILMAIVIFVLAGCAASNPTGTQLSTVPSSLMESSTAGLVTPGTSAAETVATAPSVPVPVPTEAPLPEEIDLASVSDELRAEITSFYGVAGKQDDENYIAGRRYYGTYNGYVILMQAGALASIGRVEIDGRVFKWGSSSLVITAYKDGEEQTLKEVYQSGGITSEDLDTILLAHKIHFVEKHNWDHDG